jgi:putative two-component system response regulator
MTKHRGEHFDPELLDVFFASLNDIKHIHDQYADQLPRTMIPDSSGPAAS